MTSRFVMSLGEWKRRLGDAVPLRQAPAELDLTPTQIGSLVKRKSLPVHSFKIPGGAVIRMVRRRDLDLVRASMTPPSLKDLAEAMQIMVAQG